jgi:hypothetical protein
LLTEGVADGDARAELLKLAVRRIVEEALVKTEVKCPENTEVSCPLFTDVRVP